MRHRRLTAGTLLLVLVVQFGCASNGVDKRSASSLLFPVPMATFQELGEVGVTSGRFAPRFEYKVAVGSRGFVIDEDDPSKGTVWGASKGAVKGFFAPLQLGAAGTPFVLPIIAVLMPVGLVAGAIEGAKKAESGVKAEEQEAMTQMVADQKIQDDLRDRVVAIGRVKTPHTLTVLTDKGPTAVDERPGYRLLSQEGIQTVLEVVVESVTLNCDGKWSTSSLLRMDLIVRIRLIRTVDDERIYLNWVTYKGGKERTMEEWVSDPEGLQNELNRAYTDIAERTVEEVFLRTESN